jgi:phosphoribosylformylglycinamidine synthase
VALQRFLAAVDVRLKAGVFDPQGQAVARALRELGFTAVEDVSVGKRIEVRLAAPDEDAARAQVERMCRELLANPVLEAYGFQLFAAPAAAAPGMVGGAAEGQPRP